MVGMIPDDMEALIRCHPFVNHNLVSWAEQGIHIPANHRVNIGVIHRQKSPKRSIKSRLSPHFHNLGAKGLQASR